MMTVGRPIKEDGGLFCGSLTNIRAGIERTSIRSLLSCPTIQLSSDRRLCDVEPRRAVLRRSSAAGDCSALMLLHEPSANIPLRLAQLRFLTYSPWPFSNDRVLVVSNDSRYHGA